MTTEEEGSAGKRRKSQRPIVVMEQVFMRRDQVEAVTGLSTRTLYELIEAGDFPKPVRIGVKSEKGAVGWVQGEVDAWQKQRIAERDRAA